MENRNPVFAVVAILSFVVTSLWLSRAFFVSWLKPESMLSRVENMATSTTASLAELAQEFPSTIKNTLTSFTDTPEQTGPQTVFASPETKTTIIVNGLYPTQKLRHGQTLTTTDGQIVKIVVRDGKLWVNGQAIAQADLAARDGVMHILVGQ